MRAELCIALFGRLRSLKDKFVKIERFLEVVLIVELVVIKSLWLEALFILVGVVLNFDFAALSFSYVVGNQLFEVVGGVGFPRLSVRGLEVFGFVTGWFFALRVEFTFVVLGSVEVLRSSGELSFRKLDFFVGFHHNDTEEVAGDLVDLLNWIRLSSPCFVSLAQGTLFSFFVFYPPFGFSFWFGCYAPS